MSRLFARHWLFFQLTVHTFANRLNIKMTFNIV